MTPVCPYCDSEYLIEPNARDKMQQEHAAEVAEWRQRLERAVQIATESREMFRKIHSYLGWEDLVSIDCTLIRLTLFIESESQRTTDGEAP